jgi:hypothetical protein
MLLRVWTAIDELGDAVLRRVSTPMSAEFRLYTPFTQESLVAFVDMIQSARKAGRLLNSSEWSLERLTRLMAILKGYIYASSVYRMFTHGLAGVLTYPNSPDYRPDIDSLPPVQVKLHFGLKHYL